MAPDLMNHVQELFGRLLVGPSRSTGRAVHAGLVHATDVQCPGMLPDINLLIQSMIIDISSSVFHLQSGGAPSPLCTSQTNVKSHSLSSWLRGATIFGDTLPVNWSNTAGVYYRSREPARPWGVLVHPYSGHEALALTILSLAIMNHMTLGKLFDIPALPFHPK